MKKHFYCSILCLIGLSFCANGMEASKKAAGVFLVSKNDSGQFVTLIGQRDDCDYWCNLGGQSEEGEEIFVTAAREAFEESFGQFAIPHHVLKNSKCITNKNIQGSQYGTTEYTMYFQYVNYIDDKILNQIKDKKREHSEYRQFAWRPLDNIENDAHKLMPEFKASIALSKNIINGILDGSEKLEWQFDIETEKQNIINEQKGKIQNIIDDRTLDKSVLSPSLKFLQIILGKEKITEKVLQNDDLLWNYIVEFWDLWTSLHSRELQKKVRLDEDAKEAITSAIRFEQTEYLKGNRVVYHGLDGKLLFLYKYWGKIFSLIYGKKLDYVLRGDAANFIKDGKIRKLDNVIQNEHLEHYGNSIDKIFLFVNPMLFLGSFISNTTSSSLEYFLAQHSVKTHSLKSLLSTFFLMLGMDSGSTTQACNELKSLYRQFLKYNNADKLDMRCNGGLLAISIPQQDINKISISNSSYKDEGFDANKFFENVINYTCEWSAENKYDIQELTNEFRVYLDPSYSFKINAFWHYSPKNYELFEHRLETLAEMHLSKMLGFMQVDNVLYHDANIFTEYQKIHPDIELKNNLNISDTIISLFENGLDTAISDLLQRGLIELPDFCEIKGVFLKSIALGEEKLFQLIAKHYSRNIDQMQFENNILIALSAMSEDAQNINAMSSILNSMWKKVNENGGPFLAKIIFNHYISTEDYQKLPIIFNTNSAQTVFNSMLKQHEKIGTQVIKNLINSGMNFDPLTEDGKKNFDHILSLPRQDNVENIKFIIDHYKLYNTEYVYELCYDLSTNNLSVGRSFATGACTPDSVEIYTYSENDEKLKIDVSKFKLPMFCNNLLIEGIGPDLLSRSQYFFCEVSSYLPYRVFLGEIDGHIWSKKLQDICNDKSTTWESIENHINNLDEIGLLLINMDKLDKAVLANIKNDKFIEGLDDKQREQFSTIETEEGAKIFVENAILNYFKKHYISLESHNLEYTEYMPVWSILKSIDNIRLESKCEAFIDRILANYEQKCRCSNIYLPPEYKLFSYISDSFVKQNETRLPIELLYNLVRFGDTSPNSLSTNTLSELYAYSHRKFDFLCMLLDNEELSEDVIKFVKQKFEDKFIGFQFTNMDILTFYCGITKDKTAKKILKKLKD